MNAEKRTSPERPIEEMIAGDAFRQSVIPRADEYRPGGVPVWHGWVIMDAFLAGIDWARAQASELQKPERK